MWISTLDFSDSFISVDLSYEAIKSFFILVSTCSYYAWVSNSNLCLSYNSSSSDFVWITLFDYVWFWSVMYISSSAAFTRSLLRPSSSAYFDSTTWQILSYRCLSCLRVLETSIFSVSPPSHAGTWLFGSRRVFLSICVTSRSYFFAYEILFSCLNFFMMAAILVAPDEVPPIKF